MVSLKGGLSAMMEATSEVQEICEKVKPQVEEKTGKAYEVFEAKEYAYQVVAGRNYHIKVHVGNDDHLHLGVFENLKGELSLNGIKDSNEEEIQI